MKHRGYKCYDFSGCEKNPVTAFAPICFTIDIIFV